MLAAASLVTTTTATTANPADHRTTTTVPFLTKNSHSILYFSRDLSLRISDKIAETEKEKEKTKAESPRKEKNKEKEKSKSKAGSPTSRKKSEHGRHSPTLAELVTTTKKVQQTHKRSHSHGSQPSTSSSSSSKDSDHHRHRHSHHHDPSHHHHHHAHLSTRGRGHTVHQAHFAEDLKEHHHHKLHFCKVFDLDDEASVSPSPSHFAHLLKTIAKHDKIGIRVLCKGILLFDKFCESKGFWLNSKNYRFTLLASINVAAAREKQSGINIYKFFPEMEEDDVDRLYRIYKRKIDSISVSKAETEDFFNQIVKTSPIACRRVSC